LIGLLYIATATLMLLRPAASLAMLTLAVGVLLFAESLLRGMAWWQVRGQRHSTWVLADAILTLALGAWIAMTWPWSSIWLLGSMVGASLIVTGIAGLVYSHREGGAAARREQGQPPPSTANFDQLRHAIDTGSTGSKVAASDPSAAPLGTDDEAGGASADPALIARVLAREVRNPAAHPEPRRARPESQPPPG
jgi:hypothetical protein